MTGQSSRKTILDRLRLETELDVCYWMLSELDKELSNGKPKSPIVAMIDRATGYNAAMIEQHMKELLQLIRRIIFLKKKMGLDTKDAQEFKRQVEKLRREQ